MAPGITLIARAASLHGPSSRPGQRLDAWPRDCGGLRADIARRGAAVTTGP